MKFKRHSSHTPLENTLNSVLEKTKSAKSITLGDIFQILAGRGYPILLILLSLPFCQPLQIPGTSTPFGIVIMFIGARMAFGKRPWWPQWILNREVSAHALQKVLTNSIWIIKKVQKVLHPRWEWVFAYPLQPIVHGIIIMSMGAFLALPLPIPLSNIIAAWGLIFIGFGLLEEDGLLIVLGYALGLICLGILLFLAFSLRYLYISLNHG